VAFDLSRKSIAANVAPTWESVEAKTTEAKRTRKLDTLAAAFLLWKELGEASGVARTYLQQGDAAITIGDPTSAHSAYEEALRICASTGDMRCMAEAANNSGLAGMRLSLIDEALQRLQEAADYWRRLANRRFEGMTLSNLGLLFWQTGDLQQAIAMNDWARQVLRGSDPSASARVTNNLGLCYLSLAEYDKARVYLEQALHVFLSQGDTRSALRAHINLGRAWMLSGQLGRAQTILEAALASAMTQPDRSMRADALNNLGQVELARGRVSSSETRLDEALQIYRQLHDKRGESATLHHLGLVAREQQRFDSARQLLVQAVQIRRECALRDDAATSLYALAGIDFSLGNQTEARELIEQAIVLAEAVRGRIPGPALRASYYARRRQFFDLMVDIIMAGDEPDRFALGFQAVERGRARALLDVLAAERQETVPKALLARRRDIQRRIDLESLHLSTAPESEAEKMRARVDLLLGEDAEIEARINEALGSNVRILQVTSIENVQRELLPEDTAILEYYLGKHHSYLWLIDRNSAQVFSLPPRGVIEAQSSQMVSLFGDILDRRRSPQKQAAFEWASKQLSTTLLRVLQGAAVPTRLILIPDGVLNRVPFAALRLPSSGEFLGLTHELIQVPAASYLMVGKRPRPPSTYRQAILAVADPVFSPDDSRVASRAEPRPAGMTAAVSLPRLPFDTTIDTISGLVPPAQRLILRGFDATADELRKRRLEDFRIIHLSTHALVDDRTPELSSIALSMVNRNGKRVDGFLHSYQLAQLNLDGSTVVLSACRTALGKQVSGEGIAGFASSLFFAGAAQLVLTLVNVDAEGSEVLLAEAYRRALGRNAVTGMESPLTGARRVLAHSDRWSDPYYWASFVVMGVPAWPK
jgi:CHAT domain-containing protein/tetratricopeptide (TPR) repeat protein